MLSLGSPGNSILRINGNLNRAGIGTDVPAADLEIRSGNNINFPQLQITQTTTGEFGRLRFKKLLGQFWDVAATHGASTIVDDRLNFYNSRTGTQIGFNAFGAIVLNNSAVTSGQVIQSNGGGTATAWVSPTNTLYNATGVVNAGLPYSADGTPTTI
ncbi:MAG: hypothetical protein V4722_00155 [Bacteroidota bacterium]